MLQEKGDQEPRIRKKDACLKSGKLRARLRASWSWGSILVTAELRCLHSVIFYKTKFGGKLTVFNSIQEGLATELSHWEFSSKSDLHPS